jgi:histidyl-tRNA synthetase
MIAEQLRKENLKVVCYPDVGKLQKQFKFADRKGIRFVVVLGPDEISTGSVTIKDLHGHTQVTVPQEMASKTVFGLLAAR